MKRINRKQLAKLFSDCYGGGSLDVSRDPKRPREIVVVYRFRDGNTMTLRGASLVEAAKTNPRLGARL